MTALSRRAQIRTALHKMLCIRPASTTRAPAPEHDDDGYDSDASNNNVAPADQLTLGDGFEKTFEWIVRRGCQYDACVRQPVRPAVTPTVAQSLTQPTGGKRPQTVRTLPGCVATSQEFEEGDMLLHELVAFYSWFSDTQSQYRIIALVDRIFAVMGHHRSQQCRIATNSARARHAPCIAT